MDYDRSILEFDGKADLTIEVVKKAYRKLLKKYHPDLNKNDLAYTEKIISINEAYHRLLGRLAGECDNCRTHRKKSSGETGRGMSTMKTGLGNPMHSIKHTEGLVRYKDQAYAFYKQGFIHFDKIISITDPISGFKLARAEASIKSRDITRQVEEDSKEIAALVSKQLYHASRAIYYFSIVRSEYNESEWAYDAHSKIIHIKKYLEKNLIMIKEFLSQQGNHE